MSNTLFIYPQDQTKLPNDYIFGHNLCVRLYDQLVRLLLDPEIQDNISYKLNLKEKGELPEDEVESILDWMERNDFNQERQEVISRHLCMGLISDICHFLYQALEASKNVRMTVALSLIRKPFLENLSILEQLLINEDRFMELFAENPEKYEPAKLGKEDREKVIDDCLKKIEGFVAFDASIIYQLRWDKTNPNSIYANSNLATHLVTTRNSSYRTEKLNLNLIFSGYDEWNSQLSYFYYYLPFLIIYLLEVVDQYLGNKQIIPTKLLKQRRFIRMIAQMFQTHDGSDKSSGYKALTSIADKFSVECSNCNKPNNLFFSDFFSLVQNEYILCKYCLSDLMWETDSLESQIDSIFPSVNEKEQ